MSDYLEQPGNSGTTGANLEQPGTTLVRPGKLKLGKYGIFRNFRMAGDSGTIGANLEQPGTTRIHPGKLGKVWNI